MKRVTSPAPMEKPCQLMIEPGELVTLSVRASGRCIVTAPLTICGPVGFAHAGAVPKQLPTARAIGRTSHLLFFTDRLPVLRRTRYILGYLIWADASNPASRNIV